MRRAWNSLFGLFIFTAIASAQVEQLEVTATFARDSILIGDRLELNIKASGKGRFYLILPPLTDTLPGGFYVLGKPVADSLLSGNSKTYNLKVPVSAYDQGTFRVENMPLLIKYDGKTDTLRVSSNSVAVNLIPRDTTFNDIKDIKPPLKEPIRFSEVAPWAGLGLLLVALIALAVMYLRSRKQNKPFLGMFKPKEPAHIIALRELKLMEEQREWDTDNHKLYFTKLVDILRNYIDGRFGIKAPELTSNQIMKELEESEYDFTKYNDTLRDFLFTSDLVKFAKNPSTSDENYRFLKFAIDFVEGTKPADVSEPNQGKQNLEVSTNETTSFESSN